ncbi:MAG: hypothetical protein JSR72_06130 [Proteobacteria bacterium]|nr:hypothetical protein [Pseudomonadota bacterium]
MFRSIALDQCRLVRSGYFTGMPNNESGAKVNSMIHMEGASGSTTVPPPAVSPAAWPHERSLLVWMAANCERCDEAPICEATGEPLESCPQAAAPQPKKII